MTNVQVSVFTWQQRTCLVCEEPICGQGVRDICSRCFGLVRIEENRPSKRNRLTKRVCLECGEPLHRGTNAPNKSGLCHHCSCVANGRKRFGAKHT